MNIQNQPENKKSDSLMRRDFLKAATFLGLGIIAAGTVAEINEIESKIEKIDVEGDHYDALQQSRVEY